MTHTAASASGLLRADHIICSVNDEGVPNIVRDGAIHYRDGKIVAVGDAGSLIKENPDLAVTHRKDSVVTAGFVNSHHHVGLTPLQLGSPDYPLELWFASRLGARTVDPYLDALYSAFELVASGVTTVQHLHGRMFGSLDKLLEGAQQTLRAYRDIGMRASYSYGIRDQNRLVYQDDLEFCASLPQPLGDRLARKLREQAVPVSDALALFFALNKELPQGGRIRAQLAPQNLHWCSDRALSEIDAASKSADAPMHMHLLETAYQREYALRRTGGSPVQFLHKIGMLGTRLTIGHGVWCSQADLELLQGTGTCVCCNASSNLRLRSGIAPYGALKQNRIPLAMGIDEAGINEDRDMLLEMRMLLRLSRNPGMDDLPLTPAEVLKIATEGGAATTPFKGQIGLLKPGYSMDCVAFDWSEIAAPFLDTRTSIVDALIQRAKPQHVRSVMVEGREIYANGNFTCVDREEILKQIRARMSMAPTEDELERANISKEVFAHVQNFYRSYADFAGARPHTVFNAR